MRKDNNMGTLTISNGWSRYENYTVPYNEIADYINLWAKGNWAAKWVPDSDEAEPEQTFGVDMTAMDEYEEKMRIMFALAYPVRYTSPHDIVTYTYNPDTGQLGRLHAG